MLVNDVIITLTTIPERLSDEARKDCGLLACLKSLLCQNHNNYQVQINVPHVYKTKNIEYIIPDYISELEDTHNNFKIHRCEDVGPPTKLAPTIQTVTDLDKIIIVVDDDFEYHPEMINEHLYYMGKHPDSCIAWDGLNVIGQKFYDVRDRFATLLYRAAEVSIVQHYKGVSYKRCWFEDDFFSDFVGKTRSDDVLVSAYMGKQGINRIVPHSKYDDENKGDSRDIDTWQQMLSTMSFPIAKQCCSADQVGTKDPEALKIEERFYSPPEFQPYINHQSIERCKYRLPEHI